jgi:hypothetical protein
VQPVAADVDEAAGRRVSIAVARPHQALIAEATEGRREERELTDGEEAADHRCTAWCSRQARIGWRAGLSN